MLSPARHPAHLVASSVYKFKPYNALIPARRCYASSQSPNSRRRKPLIVLSVLATGGAAAAYLFCPDASRHAPTYANALLSSTHFTPATLTSSQECPDPDTRLITLTVPRQSVPSQDESLFGPIWSVFIKDDDIQVERPYTPLEGVNEEGHMQFWIKKYSKGEVGRWLHSKKVGDTIELRGPLKTWQWLEDAWDEVIMISGGTGITPFYQLLHEKLLRDPVRASSARFTLLHASRKLSELPPPEILDRLLSVSKSHPERLNVSIYVDSAEGPSHPSVALNDIHVGRINREVIKRAAGTGTKGDAWWRPLLRIGSRSDSRGTSDLNNKKIMFLVCGPEPMIAAIAGPYGRNYSQGDIGGVLGSLGYRKEQVWKL